MLLLLLLATYKYVVENFLIDKYEKITTILEFQLKDLMVAN